MININTKDKKDYEKECKCGNYTPYEPKGICSPMMPIGKCMNYPKEKILYYTGEFCNEY